MVDRPPADGEAMILLVPLAFLAALAGSHAIAMPWWPAILPAGLGATLLLLARRPAHVAGGLALLALALGILRAELAQQNRPVSGLSRLLASRPVAAVRGVVADEPVPRERVQQVRLRVDAARGEGEPWTAVSGYVQITTGLAPALAHGEVVEVRGQIKLPEADVSPGYAAYLRRQGVDAVAAFPSVARLGYEAPDRVRAATVAARRHLAGVVAAYLPEPQAALVAGMLIGQRATIPRDLMERFNRSGTSHMIAISGFNVSLVIGAVATLMGGLRSTRSWRRWLTAALASAALWAFVLLVGWSGSVLRAAAMAQLALIGHALGRSGGAGSLLLWGSAFLAAWRPDTLDDPGWQLSFLGTAGLVWLAPVLGSLLGRWPWLPAPAREALATTLAAQVFVLPVLAGLFGQVSLVAPLANVLGLPLVPAIMLGGAALLIAGTAFPPAAPLFAALTWVPATALVRLVDWAAAPPWAAAGLPPWNVAAVAAYLAALALLCAWAQHRGVQGGATAALPLQKNSGWLPRLALAALGVLACAGWAMACPATVGDQPRLVASVPAIAEGSLAMIRAADGARVLVNGGPAAGSAATLLGEQLRPWDRTIDVVVLADPREPYVLGLPRVLERYRVGLLLDAADDYPTAAYRRVREVAGRRGIRRLPADVASEIAVGRHLIVEVLGLETEGAPSLSGPAAEVGEPTRSRGAQPPAIRIRSGDFSLLIFPDAAVARQNRLLSGGVAVQSTVLLLTERTARAPAGVSLLRAVSPELVVVQGNPRSASPAPAGAAPQPEAPEGEPAPGRPGWHRTAVDGPARIEVRGAAYQVLGR